MDAGISSVHARRRDTIFAQARERIRSDPAGFAEAGRRLDELFPAKRKFKPDHSCYREHGPAKNFCLFTRVSAAASAAIYPDSLLFEHGCWFDYQVNGTDEKRLLAARLTILAILLGADPEANKFIKPEICKLGSLPWFPRSKTKLGRCCVSFSELDWPHASEPSPRVLDRLEGAIGQVTKPNVQPRLRRPKRTDVEKARESIDIHEYLNEHPDARRDDIAKALNISPAHVSESPAWKQHKKQQASARKQNRVRAVGGVGDPSVGPHGELDED